MCTRILLAIGFLPASLTKIQGEPFTTTPISHPVGYFFDALHRTGAYWNFIGWVQLVAAILLLHPRTATLGALVFFPVILNIFVITVSLPFGGTWVISGMMLLACTYLVCWDYDRVKLILRAREVKTAVAPFPSFRWLERSAYGLMVAGGLILTLVIRRYMAPQWIGLSLLLGTAGGACLLAVMIGEHRERRTAIRGRLTSSSLRARPEQ